MTARTSLIVDLENAVQRGSPERRVENLRRITDLFLGSAERFTTEHVALFDREHEWIEMRLRARREHTTLVRDLDLPVHFDAGEEMRTEISAKFTRATVEGALGEAEMQLEEWFTDPRERFALALASPTQRRSSTRR